MAVMLPRADLPATPLRSAAQAGGFTPACACIGTMNSPRAVAGRDSVLDCGSPLPLFLARVGWESARSQGEHTCRKHFFVSFFAGLWLTMQCLEKTSVRGFLLSGTDFIRRRKSSSVRQRFPSSTHCSRPRPAPFDRDRQLWRGVVGPQRSRLVSRG